MEFVLGFLANIIYVGCFLYIGQLLLSFKRKNMKYEQLVWIVSTLLTTIICIYADVWVKGVAHLFCILLTLVCYFAEKKRTLCGLYLGGTAILSICEMMFELVILELASYWQLELSQNLVDLISCTVIGVFIWGIGEYFGKKYPEGLKKVGVNYLIVFAVILLADASILAVLGDFVMNVLDAERKWVYVLLYIAIVIGILLQIVLLINALITRNVYKENEALAKKYLDYQNEHYLYLEKREVETKKFRHDVKNHLMILEDQIKHADYEGAEKYLDAIQDKVGSFGSRISVNNSIADAILNKYCDEAEENGIELKISGHFPQECKIVAYDICTVLSNLLSNAILAEEQANGTSVSLDIRYTDKEILLVVENDYINDLRVENGVFKSTKENVLGHGYGLVNVRECVENNGGTMMISTDNSRFKVMLTMKNE